jgi:hypothetical protein
LSRFFAISLSVVCLVFARVEAQNGSTPQAGDPPIAALISLSPPDEDGIVTISGAPGAVFPNARLAIRNLYTEQTVYIQTGVTGSFSAQLFGPGSTPFWISPTRGNVPRENQGIPGSLPGGPGIIVYGAFPENRLADEPVTRIVLDGDLADWDAYPDAVVSTSNIRFLRNRESIYVALGRLPADRGQVQVSFSINRTPYALTVTLPPADSALPAVQSGLLRRLPPDERDLGVLPVSVAASAEAVELRIFLRDIRNDSQTVDLDQIQVLDAGGAVLLTRPIGAASPQVDEADGIVRLTSRVGDAVRRFTLGGAVGQGAGFWSARGRIDRLDIADDGQPLELELDVTLNTPDLPADLFALSMGGALSLQPVVASIDGTQVAIAGVNSNNGWSNLQTPSGLAVDNLRSEVFLGEVVTPPAQVLRRGESLRFALTFSLEIPTDLPAGLYVPVFNGFALNNGERSAWDAAGLFGEGSGTARLPTTRLPVVLNNDTDRARLPWVLFYDQPSDGSRGIRAAEDAATFALSNRVRFDSPTYILPPTPPDGGYSVEPYLLNLLPNAYDSTSAPLIPLLFPGGRLDAQITLPDGMVDDLGSASIIQNQVSTAALDERERFGEQSPVDAYQLVTLAPRFREYPFTQYGSHEIRLSGALEDVWGNRYEGGGTYTLLIAEPLDLSPGVLPGTPFEVGDAFNPVLNIAPRVPAEVAIRLRVYPLDGGEMRENVLVGQANRAGYYYSPEEIIRFATPGEYIIDYEARYTDADGRLWAGSLRSAGVIASPDAALVAHGERGLDGSDADYAPAWFEVERYAEVLGIDAENQRPHLPYHSGDVAWLDDGRAGGLLPLIRVQDTVGVYQNWLLAQLPDLARRAAFDALPVMLMSPPDAPFAPALAPDGIVNDAYSYISAVRPGVTLRQYVSGGEAGLPLHLSMDDAYNQQIGAGIAGEQPGDYLFLFGGAVIRNAEAGIAESVIYAAAGTLINPPLDPQGARVLPPYRGQTGGIDSGALVFVRQQPAEILFTPTAAQPGQVFTLGDILSIAGQVAPTLPSRVTVTITAPSGAVSQFDGLANAIGYFYSPEHDLHLDEIGVWQVRLRVAHEGVTSAGQVAPPFPSGTVPGAGDSTFQIYVQPPASPPLDWTRGGDFIFPASSPYNYNFSVPEGWTDARAYATLTMPGFVLFDAPLTITGRTIDFQYNPVALHFDFPNFENEGQGGAFVSDPLMLTFFITGTDANGDFAARARSFSLFHDRMLSLE